MTEIQKKLSIWAKLYKQCEQMELRLRSSELLEGDATAPAPSALRAEYLALKAQTDTAFKEASEALKTSERRGKPSGRC